jgi:integrase
MTMAKVTGEGTIVQLEKDKPRSKCRKWQLRVPVGMDPRTGKYRTRTRRFGGTWTEAKSALREFIEEIEGDHVQGRTDYTFEVYCQRYLESRALKREVAETTQRRQECQFKAAYRHIGKVKLEQVTPAMLNEMYIAMMRGDTLSGKPSSGSYVNQIHDNITLVFEAAKNEGIIVENPCDKAAPPRPDTKPKKAIDPAKAHEFIESLDPTDPQECAFLLAVTMGLRRGEICGLSWGDVDFERGIVDVSHSYDVMGNLKEPKTKAGIRLLPLSPQTLEALKAAKEAQAQQFEKTNKYRKPEEGYLVQDESTPVIAGHYGKRVTPPAMSRWWSLARDGYGLSGFTLHELRHTYLTLLAESGVHPKVMQELAGHSSSQITMDIYTHVNLEAKREAVDMVSKIF